jgi:hypothetical protein
LAPCSTVAAWARGPCFCLVCCIGLRRLGRAGRCREHVGRGVDAGFVVFLVLVVDSGTSARGVGTGGTARGNIGVSTLCSGTGGLSSGDAGASTLCVGTGSATTGTRGGVGTGAGSGRLVAHLSIWAIWMQAFAMLEPQVSDGTGLATWSCVSA